MKVGFGDWGAAGIQGLAALLLSLASGCSSESQSPTEVEGRGVELRSSSWDVDMAIVLTDTAGLNVNCSDTKFTLHFEPRSDAALSVISGLETAVYVSNLARNAGPHPTYGLNQLLQLPTHSCPFFEATVRELSLWGNDADADGVADSIDATGTATGQVFLGDNYATVKFTFSMHGVPDTTPPQLEVPESIMALGGVWIGSSEPLTTTSQVTLVGDGHRIPLTGAPSDTAALTNFWSQVILPLGVDWNVEATGSDLALNGFDSAKSLHVPSTADPGLFAQDGFEGELKGQLMGDAKVVSGLGTLPALGGQSSLLVPPGSSALLHLERAAAATNLRFSQQFVSATTLVGGSLGVRAGVAYGTQVVQPDPVAWSSASISTGDAEWPYAAPKQDFTLALEEAGSDVLLTIAPPKCFRTPCLPDSSSSGILIDDIRFE
ncbi:MAG: hypothetical protein QM756_19825 [Polyangiaceae bacterium]